MSVRPTSFPDFCTNNPSNMVAPSASVISQGFLPGAVLPAENFNQLLGQIGGWVRYLEGTLAATTTLSTIDPNIRLLGGGQYQWVNSTNTLSWSEPITFAYPGLPDSANVLAAGSVTIPSGSVAYVTTNNPIVVASDVMSGSATLSNVARPGDIQVGWQVSGSGIPSGTTVQGVDTSAQSVTLSNKATATAAQAAISFARVGALSVQVASMASYAAGPSSVILARATDSSCIVGVGTGQMHLGDSEQRRFLRQGFGTTLNVTAGVALSQGQAVYISQGTDGRTAGSAYPCDASAANGATRGKFIGFVYQAAAAGSTARLACSGLFPVSSALTQGATYYADPATPGAITATRPAQLLQYVVPVGQAVSSSMLLLPNVFQATPRTLESLCDKVVVPCGSMRFETSYKSTTGNLIAYKIVPSSGGPIFAAFYTNFDGSPFLTRVDAQADTSSLNGALSFSLQYAYDKDMLGVGPYGVNNAGTALSLLMAKHSFLNNTATYFNDVRAQNFVLLPSTTFLANAAALGDQTTNTAVNLTMTLAYPPA